MSIKRGLLGDEHGEVEIVNPGALSSGDIEIVRAARMSVSGGEVKAVRSNERLIRYLVKHGHLTPLEFVRFTFRVRAPLFVARQWMRHRAGAFSEESARYGVMRQAVYVPTPARLEHAGQAKSNRQATGEPLSFGAQALATQVLTESAARAYDKYTELLDLGLGREVARLALPVSTYTQFTWSVDLRNLMHFIKLRTGSGAQWEIQKYAHAILELAQPVAPVAFEAAGL